MIGPRSESPPPGGGSPDAPSGASPVAALGDERLRMAFEVARMVAWDWDLATDALLLSGSVARELSEEGVSLRTGAEGRRLLHPDDVRAFDATLAAAVRKRRPFVDQVRVISPVDGRFVAWAEVHGCAEYDAHGEPRRMHGVAIDVTEARRAEARARESEARLRLVADHVPAMIAHIDRDGTFLFANAQHHEWFGVEPGELVGRHVSDLLDEETCRAHRPYIERVLAGETVTFEGTTHHRALGVRSTEATYVPDTRSDGTVAGFFVMVSDITERKRIEAELRQSRTDITRYARELEAQDRRKNDFLAVLGHELRNPLAAIANGLRLARSPRASEGDRAWVTSMLGAQVDLMTRLLDDLLDLSRVVRGKIELRPQDVDVAEVLQRAVEATRDAREQQTQRLDVSVTPTGLSVWADPARLEQVVVNLLSNAGKYSEQGSTIGLRARLEDGLAVIAVSDAGVGIDPADQDLVFQPFAQLHRPGWEGRGGLGIGLSLVKQLVELHGGSIVVESAGRGMGSTFTLRLPRAFVAPRPGIDGHAPAEPPALPEPAAARAPQPQGVRVLLVEDNGDAAQTLARLLEMNGCVVDVASTGRAAIRKALANRPDIALVDLGLPDMGGDEVAAELVRRQARPKVLCALTGFGHEDVRRRLAAAGFDEHLVKPTDFQRLLAIVRGARSADPSWS